MITELRLIQDPLRWRATLSRGLSTGRDVAFTTYGLALYFSFIKSSVGVANLSLKNSGCVILKYSVSTNVLESPPVKEDEPVHEISNSVVCATNKASDQPAHTRSLIRAFASRFNILILLSY